jgi:putative tributyrin esterase
MTMGKYRSVALSDPEFERDGLRFLTFKSPALKGRGDVSIFIPEGCEAEQAVPLVLLLHGVYASHWAWPFLGGAHLTAGRLEREGRIRPMVLAMPSDGLWGDGTGYLPHASADYEKWIVEDVVGCVTDVVPSLTQNSQVFIAGLSMGGYAALRLGIKYAHRFSAISAHSAVTHPSQFGLFVEESLSEYRSVPETELEIPYLAARGRESLPPLRFDCGTSDELIDENRALHENLVENRIPHEYFEFEGGHDWLYWRTHLEDTLLFFERHCR